MKAGIPGQRFQKKIQSQIGLQQIHLRLPAEEAALLEERRLRRGAPSLNAYVRMLIRADLEGAGPVTAPGPPHPSVVRPIVGDTPAPPRPREPVRRPPPREVGEADADAPEAPDP